MHRLTARACLIATAVLILSAAGLTQQHFQERSGEWEFTSKFDTSGEPLVLRYCLTDETWAKALAQHEYCNIHDLVVTSRGFHYKLECDSRAGKTEGDVEMTFDGREHMTGKSTITSTFHGKTTTATIQSDDRWKGPVCTDADVNMKKKSDN